MKKMLSVVIFLAVFGFSICANASLIYYTLEGAFAAGASIASTQTFNGSSGYTDLGSQTAFNGVNFASIGAGNFGVWPNNRLATQGIGVHEITFGQGHYVTSFGMSFLGGWGANDVYQVEVAEVGGRITQVTIPGNMAGPSYFFGFTSELGVTTIHIHNMIHPDRGVLSYFNGNNWEYTQFSRSEIFGPTGTPISIPIPYDGIPNPVPIAPSVWLLGSGLIGLVGLRRRFRNHSNK